MTINLTPEIQMEIYRDKQKEYTLEMLDKLTPKIEYEPKEKEEDEDNSYINEEDKKNKPWINEQDYGYNSYLHQKNLNSSFSTESFFNTLSSGGNVTDNTASAA